MALEVRAWGRALADSKEEFCLLLSTHLSSRVATVTQSDFYVALEHDEVGLQRISKTIPLQNRMLVIFEPKSVHPLQHTRRIRSKYGTVVVTSEEHRMAKTDIVWDYGVLPSSAEVERLLEVNRAEVSNREFTVGLINENKFSMNRDESYTQRQNVIQRLARTDVTIAVAGAHWERGFLWYFAKQTHAAILQIKAGFLPAITHVRFPLRQSTLKRVKMMGRVPTQVGFLERCCYALVIENEPTYVTEKLFNALLGGSLPLYVGPDLERFDIPKNVATNLTPPLLDGIHDALHLSAQDREKWARDIDKWLAAPSTQVRWGLEPSVQRLAEIVNRFVSPN